MTSHMSASSVTMHPDAPDSSISDGTCLATAQAPASGIHVMQLPGGAATPIEEHHRDHRNHSIGSP